MLPPALLLLLLVSCTQASHFYGTVMTYYPKDAFVNGSVTVVLRYKLNFHSCSHSDTWNCNGNCGALIQSSLNKVDEESNGEWCHSEGILTRLVPSNAPFQLELASFAWINNVQSINSWKAVTEVELRIRSDTGKANTSPLTTILPAVRVPSNCVNVFSILAFDPDGDDVRCRYATGSECQTCTQPSVFSLGHTINASSSFCTLFFSPTSSSNEGSYVVQMVMEDFPRQNINLTHTNGSQVMRTTSDVISKIPIQFAVKVDPAVPSCTEGHFLPKFLSPTPDNLAQLYTPVGQELEILITAVAANSTISELLFSGPYDVNQTNSGSGNFSLRWTPSEREDGESHPLCFVVQANSTNFTRHNSELRCVIVTVGNSPRTTQLPTTTTATAEPRTTTTQLPTTTTTTAAPTTTTTQLPTPTTTTAAPTTTTTQLPTTTTTTAAPTTTTTQLPTTITSTAAPTTTTTQLPTTTTTTAAPTTTTTQLPTTTTTTAAPTTTTTQLPTTTTTTAAPTTTTTQLPTTTTTTAAPTTTTTTTTTAAPTTTTTTPPTTTTTAPTTTTTTPPTTITTMTPPTTTVSSTSASSRIVVVLRMKISTTLPLDNTDTIQQLFKDELVRRGIPSNTILKITKVTPSG